MASRVSRRLFLSHNLSLLHISTHTPPLHLPHLLLLILRVQALTPAPPLTTTHTIITTAIIILTGVTPPVRGLIHSRVTPLLLLIMKGPPRLPHSNNNKDLMAVLPEVEVAVI